MKDRYLAYSRKDQTCLKCIHDFVLDIIAAFHSLWNKLVRYIVRKIMPKTWRRRLRSAVDAVQATPTNNPLRCIYATQSATTFISSNNTLPILIS